jgi:hypothetical protein
VGGAGQASEQLTMQAAEAAAELAKEKTASATTCASLSDELGHLYRSGPPCFTPLPTLHEICGFSCVL